MLRRCAPKETAADRLRSRDPEQGLRKKTYLYIVLSLSSRPPSVPYPGFCTLAAVSHFPPAWPKLRAPSSTKAKLAVKKLFYD